MRNGYRTQQGDFDYEPPEDLLDLPCITEQCTCSNCNYAFDVEELSACFVAESGGVQPSTPDGPAVHWATGYVVCPQCRVSLPYEVSE